MRVKLYDIFGDNYIIAVGSMAGGRKIEGGVEIPDQELKIVIKTGEEIAKYREERRKEKPGSAQKVSRILPMSGNDQKPFEEALQCLNIPSQSRLSEVFSKLDPGMEVRCKDVSAPSFVKPEMYEFTRSPGYKGSRKANIKVDPIYLMLSALGWVLTRLGEAKVSNRDKLGVHLFPIDVDRGFSSIPDLLKKVSYVPGIYPTPAFLLWLSYQMKTSNAIITSGMSVYTMSDAGGQSPATVMGGFTTNLRDLLNHPVFDSDVAFAIEALSREALNLDSDKRTFAIRATNLLYEVMTRARGHTELLYFTNRELLSIKLLSGEVKKEDQIYSLASRLAWKVSQIGGT